MAQKKSARLGKAETTPTPIDPRADIPGHTHRHYYLDVSPEPWPRLIDQFLDEASARYRCCTQAELLAGVPYREIWRVLFEVDRIAWPGEPPPVKLIDSATAAKIFDLGKEQATHRANAIELGKILVRELVNRGHDEKPLLKFLNAVSPFGDVNGNASGLWPDAKLSLQGIAMRERLKGSTAAATKAVGVRSGEKIENNNEMTITLDSLELSDKAFEVIRVLYEGACLNHASGFTSSQIFQKSKKPFNKSSHKDVVAQYKCLKEYGLIKITGEKKGSKTYLTELGKSIGSQLYDMKARPKGS